MEVVPVKVNKSVFLSKTFWFGVVTAVAPLFPAVQAVIASNVEAIGMFWGFLSMVLRMVTKEKVILIP